jgi:hypothetical protein
MPPTGQPVGLACKVPSAPLVLMAALPSPLALL